MLARKVPMLTLTVLLAAVAGLLPAWPQQSPPQANAAKAAGDKIVISVGDERITAAELDEMLRVMPSQYRAYYSGPGRSLLPQYIVQMKILSAEAIKRNLQATPGIQTAIELARESILANAAREAIEQSLTVSDQQLEALYESRKAEFEEARIRRILIQTTNAVLKSTESPHPPVPPEEARKKLEALRKQILAGADFTQLARADSDDQATAAAGGDMGFVTRQNLLPPIAQAAFSLKPGEVSEVILTPYGYELIQVEERRTTPLAEVKERLEAELRQSEFEKEYQELVKKYNVVVDSQFFTTPPAPPKPSATPTH